MTYGLVWLIKASIQNFSFHGGLEVSQIYLSEWVGWGGCMGAGTHAHTDYKTNFSSQLDLHCNCQLELSLAIHSSE